MQTKAILSLVYKLIDCEEFILFGGIVRDIILPSYLKGISPFEKNYKPEAEIVDIDMAFRTANDANVNDTVRKLTPKLREWDWKIISVENMDVYGGVCARVFVSHCWAEVDVHLDLVPISSLCTLDFDVNIFRFDKYKGLYTAGKHRGDISSHFSEQKKIVDTANKIKDKTCTFLLPNVGEQHMEIKYAKRFVKMLKKGWTIENIGPLVSVVEEVKDSECQICGNLPHGRHVLLTCSNCTLCFECFQGLITSRRLSDCVCPTCREKVTLWEV